MNNSTYESELRDAFSDLLEKIRDLRGRQLRYGLGDYSRTPDADGLVPMMEPSNKMNPLINSLQTNPSYLRECDPILDSPDTHEDRANCRPVPPLRVSFNLKAQELSTKSDDISEVIDEIVTHLRNMSSKINFMKPKYRLSDIDSVRDVLKKWFSFFDEGVDPGSDANLTERARIALMKLEKQYLEVKLAEIIEKNRKFEMVINDSKKEFHLARPAHYYAISAADSLFDAYMEILDRDARLNKGTIHLPKPIGNILHEKGYETLRDIVKLKYNDMMEIPGIAQSRIDMIIDYFRESGLPRPVFAFHREISRHPENFDFVYDVRHKWRAKIQMDYSQDYAWTLPKLYRPFYAFEFSLDNTPHLRVIPEDPKTTNEAPPP